MKTNEILTKSEKLLKENGVLSIVPKGNSMWPFIKNKKNSVIIKSVLEELSIYDVIFYKRESGQEVLHRIIGFKDDDYIVSGDSLIQREIVKKENVFGVMQGYYKNKKYIDAKDQKYLAKVKKWYESKKRARKIKCFNFRTKVTNKLKIIFKKTGKKDV